MQVLARWHLFRNLSEALQETVTSHHAVIRMVAGTIRNERAGTLQTKQTGFRPSQPRDGASLRRTLPGTLATERFCV